MNPFIPLAQRVEIQNMAAIHEAVRANLNHFISNDEDSEYTKIYTTAVAYQDLLVDFWSHIDEVRNSIHCIHLNNQLLDDVTGPHHYDPGLPQRIRNSTERHRTSIRRSIASAERCFDGAMNIRAEEEQREYWPRAENYYFEDFSMRWLDDHMNITTRRIGEQTRRRE